MLLKLTSYKRLADLLRLRQLLLIICFTNSVKMEALEAFINLSQFFLSKIL